MQNGYNGVHIHCMMLQSICVVVSIESLGDAVGILVCANILLDVCTRKKSHSVVFSQSVLL